MKERLKSIIIEFQKYLPEIRLAERNLNIPLELSSSRAITIYGPRRAGKTSVLFLLMKRLMEQNQYTINNIVYINFEDNQLIDLKSEDLDLILNAYRELFPEQVPVLFLDEIQNLEGWSKWVRKLIDQKFRVFITGSNSKLLSREIATELRGRSFPLLLLPFSYLEFLSWHQISYSRQDLYDPPTQARLRHLTEQYLFNGGFPEVLSLQTLRKELILKDYLKTIVYQDIAERYHARNSFLLKFLINFCLENYGNLISVNSIYNYLKSRNIKTGKDVIYEYLDYLEEALFVFPVKRSSDSVKEQEQYGRKFYLADTGYASLHKLKLNKGRLFENMIFLEIYRRTEEVTFYHNAFECDFLISGEDGVLPVQACLTLNQGLSEDSGVLERESKALFATMDKFSVSRGLIITLDQRQFIQSGSKTIEVIPFEEWMISDPLFNLTH